jgi:hypothetical protein
LPSTVFELIYLICEPVIIFGVTSVTRTVVLQSVSPPYPSIPLEIPDAPRIPFTTAKCHFAESRITVLDGPVTLIHLNKHTNYDQCCAPAHNAENASPWHSPWTWPSAAMVSQYVAAFGSSKVGVFDITELENNAFVPNCQ